MSNYSKESISLMKRKFLEDDENVIRKKSSNTHKRDEREEKYQSEKKKKKSKKRKFKKKSKRRSSSESSSSSEESDAWVEKPSVSNPSPQQHSEPPKSEQKPTQRDDWMNMTGMFATFTRKDIKPDKEKKKKGSFEAYDPAKSSRELNPYWKDGGAGLPSQEKSDESPKKDKYHDSDRNEYRYRQSSSSHFKKPSIDDDHDRYDRKSYDRRNYNDYSSRSSWRKPSHDDRTNKSNSSDRKRESSNSDDDVEQSSSKQDAVERSVKEPISDSSNQYMTDQQMNALGAKIVKAEILGNTKLVAELNTKLAAAREYRKLHPEQAKGEDGVVLTITDERGNTRPLTKSQQVGDPRSKGNKKKADTHSAAGDRLRFFADDDKHSLQQMFEKEKFGSAKESEEEFAKIMSKHKNPNDDLEDIFAESITKNKSDAKVDKDNLNRAISQHKSTQRSLDNCEHCINSDKMIKHMIVSLGNTVYVALPDRKSLTEGHCIISTIGHVACSTMADEDVWAEILSYRKALTNLFNSRDEDVVFFETVMRLHKLPHLIIHCVPLPRDVGDTAPIYFKKAISECEAEWSNNKKVVDLRGKDVRRGVPKGLPYFWVDFGMDPGFAHVIEDQQLFPFNFAQEIVGGMLDLHHSLWRKPDRESFEQQNKKVLEFTEIWKPFDPTTKS